MHWAGRVRVTTPPAQLYSDSHHLTHTSLELARCEREREENVEKGIDTTGIQVRSYDFVLATERAQCTMYTLAVQHHVTH